MKSAVCVDASNHQGRLGHGYCKGSFRELIDAGVKDMEGKMAKTFGRRVKCTCFCHYTRT